TENTNTSRLTASLSRLKIHVERAGRKTPAIARALLRILLKRLPGDGAGTPLVFAIDDSPTKRYGPHVEGAGKHHNPDPRAGRVQVPLRPRLGLSGPAGPTSALGGDRPADRLAPGYPSQGCRLDGGLLRLAVPHEVGTGRRPDRVAGPAVGAESPANLGGDRRGLRQAAILQAGAGCGDDGDQPAAVRCGLVVVAGGGRSWSEAGSRPAAEVRQEPDRPGQTRRADAGLADRAFLPLRSARSLSEYLLVLSHGRWISLGFGLFGLGPTLCAHYPPQSTPTLQERRQIFKTLWVKHISCHSADTFSRPRNRNLRIPRADLIMPNTGSTMCLRAA